MAERDVVFTGKFQADPNARKALEDFGKQFVEMQERANKALKQIEDGAAKTAKEMTETTKKVTVDFGKLSSATVDKAKAEEQALAVRLSNQKRQAEQQAANIRSIIDGANRKYEQQAAIIQQANTRITDSLAQTGEGVLKLGRGFAMLGLVGEKDMKKILDTLIGVQAAVDLTRGGIEVYRGISEAVKAYRSAVLAAAAAESVLAAARAKTAASGGAGLLPGGGAAGLVGAGTLAATATTALIASIPVSAGVIANVGGSRDALANSRFFQRNTGPDTLVGQFLGGGGWFGDPDAKELYDEQQRARASNRKVSAQERQLEVNRKNRARDRARQQASFSIQDRVAGLGRSAFSQSVFDEGGARGLSGTRLNNFANRRLTQQQASENARLLRAQQQARGAFASNNTEDNGLALDRANQALLQGQERAVELARERLAIEQRITAERTAGIQREIDGLRQAIGLDNERLQANRDAQKTNLQRLGEASQEDFARIRQVYERARQGGEFTQEEINIGRRFGNQAIQEQINAQLEAAGRGRNAQLAGGGINAQLAGDAATLEANIAANRRRQSQAVADRIAEQREGDLAANRAGANVQGAVNAAGQTQLAVIERALTIELQGDDAAVRTALDNFGQLLDQRDAVIRQQFEQRMAERLAQQRQAGRAGANAIP